MSVLPSYYQNSYLHNVSYETGNKRIVVYYDQANLTNIFEQKEALREKFYTTSHT